MSGATKDTKADAKAIALVWEGVGAPVVSAKGEDGFAQQIIAKAKEHGIPLHEDAELARILLQLDVGEEIPPELYLAVAKVIAFAYMLAGKTSIFPDKQT